MQLEGHGIRAQLPDGWEGAIRRDLDIGLRTVGARTAPVVHLASFALPAERGDFGSGAVEVMGPGDAFVALLEYDRGELRSALFGSSGLPRRLDPRAFSPRSLQRQLRGQAGWQAFFTHRGRPFGLYVVLGDATDAHRQARRVERVLAGVDVEPAR